MVIQHTTDKPTGPSQALSLTDVKITPEHGGYDPRELATRSGNDGKVPSVGNYSNP